MSADTLPAVGPWVKTADRYPDADAHVLGMWITNLGWDIEALMYETNGKRQWWYCRGGNETKEPDYWATLEVKNDV